MLGLRRRKRIAFLQQKWRRDAWALKKSAGAQSNNTFSLKTCRLRKDESVFGLHRRQRIAFLAENGQALLRRSKARPRRSKPTFLLRNFKKHTQILVLRSKVQYFDEKR